METLLPCHACGNEAVAGSVEIGGSAENPGLLRAWVSCSSCRRRTRDHGTLEEAVAAWNLGQRTLQPAPTLPDESGPAAG